jgi:hypothetical protein
VTKKLKQVKNLLHHVGHHKEFGARSSVKKTHAFAEHLAKVFQLHPSENKPEEEEEEEALI